MHGTNSQSHGDDDAPAIATNSRTVTDHVFVPKRQRQGGGKPELGVIVVHSRTAACSTPYVLTNPHTLGRDASADIELDDVGVSRVHAKLEPRDAGVWVMDLGSRNGTFVAGFRVPGVGALAPPGSVIRVGKTLMVVTGDVTPHFSRAPNEHPELVGGVSLDDIRFKLSAIATTRSPVLLMGGSGTGKEVVAQAIHRASGRSGPFVALNCAAVPPELVDAELFGHARGAFSGASAARAGLFRSANSGTLFLDEIGEMAVSLQAKLLRTLETEEVRGVGEDKPVPVDTRIVAATNRSIDALVDSGAFRLDLLHRLSGLRIDLPALAERIEDIPLLVEHFTKSAGLTLTTLALEQLMLHSWPGNVRELRNKIAAACELARSRGATQVDTGDISDVSIAGTADSCVARNDRELAQRVIGVLRAQNGHVGKASTRLGMSRSLLYDVIKRLRINPKAYRQKIRR